jgi:subtilisin family serine protease
VIAILILAISPLVQNVDATTTFDPGLILHLKADPALRNLLAERSTTTSTEVRVLLVFSYIPSSQQIQELLSFGTLETFTGHVASMHLPVNLLPEVASLDFVERVSTPRNLTGQLDKSIPDISADQVWNTMRDADGNSVNGTGVVIGIIDTGIDYHHKDFFFPNGTTKILYIWDQSTDGRAPLGFDYGNECNRADIQSGTCSEIDGQTNGFDPGHGTAVAAVAASSGEAATLFSSCLRYDGTTWHDDNELCSDPGTASPLLASPSDYRYFGNYKEFSQVFFDLQSPGEYGNFTWEYSQGSGKWNSLPKVQTNQTSSLTRTGTVYFTPPIDWKTDIVDGRAAQYWIRIHSESVQRPASISQAQGNPPYRGVAPGALIIAVKIKDGFDDSFLDGISYVVKRAKELGLPVVINHSFDDVLGSHDGTEALELAFTDLASSGVPIVVAAGNERNANLHVSGKILPGQTITVPWFSNQGLNQYVDLWYSTADDLGISVRAPDNVNVTGPTPESGVHTQEGTIAIVPDQRPTGKEWFINITSTIHDWTFVLTGLTVMNGKWDAWTEPGQFLPSTKIPAPYKIDPSDTIDYPGTAKGVITVGDYMTRYYYRSGCDTCIAYTTSIGKQGIWWDPTAASGVGNVTYYTAMGPTRDGRTKPEIVAPGAMIAAARANNEPERNSDPDNYHQIDSGTSLAAPHVAGVIALMLQINPYLDPEEIRTILTETARQDQFTGKIDQHTGSPLWGWGKLNALNASLDALTLYTVRIEIAAIGLPLETNVTRDGQQVATLTLDQTRTLVLQFQGGDNHTLTLSPYLAAQSGTRYVLEELPWTFSSGGARTFHYKQQFLLQVTSAYGYASGAGWYDGNSTAVVNVIPKVTEGHEFQGWTGSLTSSSQAVEVKMDSSKSLNATWVPISETNMPSILGLALAIVICLAIALVVRYRYRRRTSGESAGRLS